MKSYKIAIQGGGAKLLTLFSAIDGIQKSVSSQSVVIEEIAGSSAGSIAGLVLALNIPSEKLRNHFQGDVLRSRLQNFILPGRIGIAYRFATGSTLLPDRAIADLVLDILNLAGIGREDDRVQLNSKLSVAITDIHRGVVHFVELNEKPADFIVQTIVDSCAIPIIFRNHKNTDRANKADGGLFENFPISNLTKNFNPAKVIGLSFEKVPPEDDFHNSEDWSFSQYIGNVVSTAIDANISASLRIIPDQNVIELPDDFHTLDFETAATTMLSTVSRHNEISELVNSKLSELFKNQREIEEKLGWIEKTIVPYNYEQMRAQASNLLEARTPDSIDKSALVYLELSSECSESDPAYRNGCDYYYERTVFEVPEEGLDCLGLTISEYSSEAEFAMFADFIVLNDNGMRVPASVLPAKSSGLTHGFKSLAIFFDKKQFPNDTKTVTLLQKEFLKGQFKKILTQGWDYLEYGCASVGTITDIKVIVGVPMEKAGLFRIEVSDKPLHESSNELTAVSGDLLTEFAGLEEIVSPGMMLMGVESAAEISGSNVFAVKIERNI